MSKIKWKLRNIKTGGVINLEDSLSRAGRMPSMKVRCTSSLVSRNHANFFILEDGSLRVMDQDTTNGTYVNGKRISRKEIVELNSGDKIALGFDPTTNYEQLTNTTFYIFEVLAGDQPVPEIIIDSETDSGTSEKIASEPLKEQEQTDKKNRKILPSIVPNEYVENLEEIQDNIAKNYELKEKNIDNVKYKNLKSPEPSTSKYSVTNDSMVTIKKNCAYNTQDLVNTLEASQACKEHLETENYITKTSTLLKGIEISNSLNHFLETKKPSQVGEIHIEPNGKQINISSKLSVIKENLTENRQLGNSKSINKNVSEEQENNSSKEEHLHKIIHEIKLMEETRQDDKDKKLNFSHRIPDIKNNRTEIKYIEDISSSLRKEPLEDRKQLHNKKNEKLIETNLTSLKDHNSRSDKENKEKPLIVDTLKNTNRLTKFKGLKVNVERLTNKKIERYKDSLTNKETNDGITIEENIFQRPTSVSSLLSKRKNVDNINASTKKIKKDLSEDNNGVKHSETTSSYKENFVDTQELLSVLTDSKEIKKSLNLINNKDTFSKGPITRSKSFNENNENETEKGPMKTTSIGFTNEDIIFVEDDDDDGSNFPCSQLFQSSQEEEVDHGVAEECNNNDESLFLNIKKELEELDKTDFVPCIMLDSDVESDWYSDSEKNITAQKVNSRRVSDGVVPGTYHNFENNNVDILYYEDTASSNNKSGNKDRYGGGKESEQNLINEERHARLSPTEETMKEMVYVSEPGSSTVPTSSFYSRGSSAKQYVVPPIVEPHRATRIRNCNKRECSNSRKEVKIQEKKRHTKKTPPKYNTTRKDVIARATSLNGQREKIKRDEIRKKVKEIALRKPDQKQKELTVKKSAVKVKVSESRGQFLLENNSHLVKNVPTINANNVLTKPSIKSLHSLEREATSSKNISSFSTKINSNTTSSRSLSLRERSGTNGLNVTNKVQVKIPNTLSSVEMKVKMDVSDIINQVIHWSASWLSQQRNKSYSPQVNKRPAVEMSAKFSSYSDYYNVVIPLLLLELWNSLYKDWSHPGNDLRKTAFCSRIEDEQVVNGYVIMKSFTYIDRERHAKGINVKEEDLVVFEVKSKHDNRKVLRTGFGFITFVSKRPVQEKDVVDFEVASVLGLAPDYCVNFTFKTKSYVDSSDKGNIMFVRLVSSMGPYLRLFKSVKYLQFSPLKEMVLNPKIENFKVNSIEPKKLFTDVKLNKSQLKAVVEATELCLGKKPGFYLIQGPPGTGKTTVITSIIQEIVFSADGPPRCVLLVAPSNGAVDELVKRLVVIRQKLDDINRKKFKVIRVGPPNSIHPKVYPFSLEYMTKSNFLREVHRIFPEFRDKFLSLQQKINELERDCKKTSSGFERLECAKKEYEKICVNNLGRKYFAELEKIRWSCLYNANVICTTLSSCFSVQMEAVFRNSGKITCCIVDEATQSNEQETLIPLMLGLEKIVLVGDPRQLCPTTLSQEAKQLKYGMSLFSRISKQFEDKPDNPIVMLDTQYRMNPEISQFPNKVYYNNRLKNGLRCLSSKFKHIKPYVVFNLAMYCPVEQYRNENEVAFIIKLLSTIVELASTTDCVDIGIITPYNNQKVKLNETLKEHHFRPNVKIIANTVDSFQGQEKDIIIVSYVRMDGNSFVSDEHRLNVALTRAKHALFVVGNKYLFDTCSVLKKIRDNAQRRKLLYIIDDSSSLDLKRLISH